MKKNLIKKFTAIALGISVISMGATAGANGDLSSSSVGGNYKVDARMQDATSGVNGSWTRNVDDSTDYVLYGNASHAKSDSMRVQFSTDITTLVSVQVTGNWKSN